VVPTESPGGGGGNGGDEAGESRAATALLGAVLLGYLVRASRHSSVHRRRDAEADMNRPSRGGGL
jgi:hypothetical protein